MTKESERRAWTVKPVSVGDESDLRVEYSPKLIARLARLQEAVRGSPYFDPDILENLRTISRAGPIRVSRAMSAIAYITREATKHASLSLSQEANDAIVDVLETLSSEDPPCVRLVRAVAKDR